MGNFGGEQCSLWLFGTCRQRGQQPLLRAGLMGSRNTRGPVWLNGTRRGQVGCKGGPDLGSWGCCKSLGLTLCERGVAGAGMRWYLGWQGSSSCQMDSQWGAQWRLLWNCYALYGLLDFPGGTSGKEPSYQFRNIRDIDSFSPWRRVWQPTPIFLPPHGERRLAGYNPWGHKESDTTEVT